VADLSVTDFERGPLAVAHFERGPLAVAHGFSPRRGGVSLPPWDALNLGASVGDDPAAVRENRRRVAHAFGVAPERVARLDQVHGAAVHVAGPQVVGREGDALISDDPAWLLAVSAADCLPIILFDARRGSVAAVHAGWRGVAAGVAAAAVRALAGHFGTDPADLRAWLGPAIQGPCYQVGPEVVAAVRADPAVPATVAWPDAAVAGRWRLDVPGAVRAQLSAAGLSPDAIAASETCTHCAAERCFSHRRDAGRTGRHWAVVRAPG
jgi:polyphenol oxidase